ncbi:hypothetical protein CCP3SC1_1000007 [Gammaproteobacteria bacterium]
MNPTPFSGSIAQQDLLAWRNMLACSLPQGAASISVNGNTVTVTIQWDTSHEQRTSGSSTVQQFIMTTDL